MSQDLRMAIRSRVPSGWPEQLFIRTWRIARSIGGYELLTRRDVNLRCLTVGNPHCQFNIVPELLTSTSTVYCAGIGMDISFDLGLIERFGLQIHAFDPSPESLSWLAMQSLPAGFHVHEYGLADQDGYIEFAEPGDKPGTSYSIVKLADRKRSSLPTRKLSSAMSALGHSSLDLLKIDIEGAEYGVIREIVSEKIQIRQLCVEFHHRWADIGVAPTRTAIGALRSAGFRIFHVSPSGAEYSFVGPRH